MHCTGAVGADALPFYTWRTFIAIGKERDIY